MCMICEFSIHIRKSNFICDDYDLPFVNHLWILSEKFPDKINKMLMGRNSNTTLDILEKNINDSILWNLAYANNNLTWEFILKHQDKFAWQNISAHKCVTWKIIKDNPQYPWDYNGVSRNPNLTMEIILSHPEKPWCIGILMDNLNLPWKYIQTLGHIHKKTRYGLGPSPMITWNDIISNPNEKWRWNWEGVSTNMHITIDIVLANLDLPWDWIDLSAHPNITLDHIKSHPELPWNMFGISWNANITLEMMDTNPQIEWDIRGVSLNPNLTSDYVINHPELKWDWRMLAYNEFEQDKIVKLNKVKNMIKTLKIHPNDIPPSFYNHTPQLVIVQC